LQDEAGFSLQLCGPSPSRAATDRIQEGHDVETPSLKQGAREELDPHIEFSEEHGVVEVRDWRLFRRGHEAFCRRLVMSAARQPDIRSASVALGSVTCRLEFGTSGPSAERMAKRFVEIMNEAIPESGRDQRLAQGEIDWATVSAFPAGEAVSCWEVVHEAPYQLRLQNETLRLDSTIARRVAKSLREVPGIVSCRVVSFRRDLRIAFDPAQRAVLAVVDAAEKCLRRVNRPQSRSIDRDESRKPGEVEGQSQLWFLVFDMRSLALGTMYWSPLRA
jgi:hypothetical protein